MRVIRRLRALGSSLSSRDLTNGLTAPLQVFVCVAPSASSLVTPGNNLRLGPIWGSPSHYGTKSNHCTPPTSARGRRGQHSGREHIVRYAIPLFLSFTLTPPPPPSSLPVSLNTLPHQSSSSLSLHSCSQCSGSVLPRRGAGPKTAL